MRLGASQPDKWLRRSAERQYARRMNVLDREIFLLAQQQANLALYLSSPNPRVGCVLARNGLILGLGHTQQAGGPHAEVMALRDAATRGHDVRGATAYVTLEPCAHQGRTGPCSDALITAGVGKVIASIADPNPLVAGKGFARLRAAGIEVETGLGADETRELNIGFFSRMVRKTPWVRMKVAASLDGRTALANGASQWITSEAARADGHAWRARACAVLTGIGTVHQDNPRLDVRAVDTPRQPHLVVVDSRLETPPDARLFGLGRQVWIYAAQPHPERQRALEAKGARVTLLPSPHGKVDLHAMLKDLARQEINEVHVEAGHTLNGAMMRERLVDELLLYQGPRLMGHGAGIADVGPLVAPSDTQTWKVISCDLVAPDIRIRARWPGRLHF